MYDLFISHNIKDKEWVRHFVSFLRFSGLKVFFDEDNIDFGEDIIGSIGKGIENSSHVILVISNSSLNSEWVALECSMSIYADPSARKKMIIPIILEEIKRENIPIAIRRLKSIDLTIPERVTLQLRGLLRQLGIKNYEVVKIPSRVANDSSFTDKTSSSTDKDTHNNEVAQHSGSRINYANLFKLRDFEVHYVPFLGGWEAGINEFLIGQINCDINETTHYQLPPDFLTVKINNYTPSSGEELYTSTRLDKYNWQLGNKNYTKHPSFTFSKLKYKDYRIVSELLDSNILGTSNTFRDRYAPNIGHHVSESLLTNICGVGLFIITRDNKIIITKHSKDVTVYPSVWGYSASGAMDWNEKINPFTEVARECFEEIGHKTDIENTLLFQFGLDAIKLYVQFSFFEWSLKKASDIIAKASMARDYDAENSDIEAISFELTEIVRIAKTRIWEPSALAGLLILSTKKFGYDEVIQALEPDFSKKELRQRVLCEWAKRSMRNGDMAVMSARYPSDKCEIESQNYVRKVLEFIGDDAYGLDVLEIGCGIGRISKPIAEIASSLTCIDLSEEMLSIAKDRLKQKTNVHFFNKFAQEFEVTVEYDVVISSLVLIHNHSDEEFLDLVNIMKKASNSIFIFEHTDALSHVSSFTKPRSESEILTAFNDYEIERKLTYKLFDDTIVFLKIVRNENTAKR